MVALILLRNLVIALGDITPYTQRIAFTGKSVAAFEAIEHIILIAFFQVRGIRVEDWVAVLVEGLLSQLLVS